MDYERLIFIIAGLWLGSAIWLSMGGREIWLWMGLLPAVYLIFISILRD